MTDIKEPINTTLDDTFLSVVPKKSVVGQKLGLGGGLCPPPPPPAPPPGITPCINSMSGDFRQVFVAQWNVITGFNETWHSSNNDSAQSKREKGITN